MSIYALKPKFQNLLRPLVRRLYNRDVTANQVTLAACAVSIAVGLLLSLGAQVPVLFWLLPVWLFVRMALNAVPFGKSDRAFFIGVLAVWYAVAGSFHAVFYAVMWLACAALVYTCYKRVVNGLKVV